MSRYGSYKPGDYVRRADALRLEQEAIKKLGQI